MTTEHEAAHYEGTRVTVLDVDTPPRDLHCQFPYDPCTTVEPCPDRVAEHAEAAIERVACATCGWVYTDDVDRLFDFGSIT